MTIEFRCTSCDKLLRVKDESAGKRAKCPGCSTVLEIPAAASPPESNPFDFSAASPGGNAPSAAPSDNPFASPQTGYAPEGTGAVGAGQIVPTRIDAGDIFNTTWVIFKSQMGMSIGIYLVVMLISFAVSFALGLVQGFIGEDAALLSLPIQLANQLFSTFLTIGLMWSFLDIARGRRASFDRLFAGGPLLITTFLTSLLVGLCIFLGFLLLIVPGIILALMFSQIYLLIIDQKLGIIESMKKSYEITNGNKLTLFLIGLGVFGLMILGAIPCLLGLIFVAPYSVLMAAVAYLRMTGQPVAGE